MNSSATILFTMTTWNQNFTTQWEFKPPASDEFSLLNSSILSDKSLNLSLPSAHLHHRGIYRITVSNLAGNTSATVELDVFGT